MTYPGTTTGRVELAYYLEIEGVGCMTTQAGWTPSTAFTGYHYAYLHWPKGVKIRESRNEKTLLDVGSISLTLDGQVISLLKDTAQRGKAMLLEDLTVDEVAFTTDTTTDFAASGTGWISDSEAFTYASKSATVFTLTDDTHRGALGTKAQTWTYDPASVPQKIPLILDGPVSLEDKRAILYVSEVTDGTPGTGSAVFIGRISRVIPGSAEWKITIEHVSRSFQRNVCNNLPQAGVTEETYYLETGADDSIEGILNCDVIATRGTTEIYYLRPSSSGAWTPEALRQDLQEQVRGGMTWGCNITYDPGEDRYTFSVPYSASGQWTQIWVYKGSPLWCLGFAAGMYSGDDNVEFQMVSDEPRRKLVLHGYGPFALECDDASDIEDGPCIISSDGLVMTVTGTTATTVTVAPDTDSPVFVAVEEKPEECWLRNVWYSNGNAITAIQRLVGSTTAIDVDESCALPGFRSTDFDWDEFTEAFSSVPADLQRFSTVVTEKIKFTELISPYLGMLGISLRITSAGKIGAKRKSTPIATGAATLDSGITLMVDDVRGSSSPLDLLTSVKVKYGYDYKTKKYSGDIEIKSDDALRQSAGTRSAVYEVRGLTGVHQELVRILRIQLDQTHLGRLGRYSQMVDVRTTYRGRAHLLSDAVLLTHDMVPDLALGVVGVTDRPSEIDSRIVSLDGTDDMLTLRMVPPTNAAGWAPCALATSYTAGTKTLTFADTEIYSSNDLSAFSLGDKVRVTDYDDGSPTVVEATIASVGSSTVVLTADIGSIPAGGAWLTPTTYEYSASREYCFVANQAARPDLDGDDPNVWGQ